MTIEQKLKICEFSIIDTIKKFQDEALKRDFEKVKNISFLAGSTITDKLEEIKSYFTGPSAFENAFGNDDLAQMKKCLQITETKCNYFFKI